MDDERHSRLTDLLRRARILPAQSLGEFVERECADDPLLAAELHRLLAQEQVTVVTPEQVTVGADTPSLPRTAPAMGDAPRQIGPYRIVRIVSAGGMGTVYEAMQQRPQRVVAVKTVRADSLSPDALRRFHDEIEVLARLKHHAIAQIYEAGIHDDGISLPMPYFAMEYIPDAQPITDWVKQHRPGLPETLRLFATVCDAVHHAHSQGIIHRDLKPANILIGASQEATLPKIIDFGIARVTRQDAMRVTPATSTGQLVGTLQYMSPEQLAGKTDAIDVRTDVYALGLLLYEMLAGTPPYLIAGLPLAEVIPMLSEQDPPRLGRAAPGLRGDLETIVGKALEKEPDRRYRGADELAADVRRHLADEPLMAHPPSGFYRASKFVRRNKALVAGVTGIMLALLVGVVALLALALQEGRARRTAERQVYASQMMAAGSALEESRLEDALEILGRAPERLRGWEWRHFHQRASHHPQKVSLPCEGPFSFAMSEDGSIYVTFCADSKFHLWNAADGKPLSEIDLPAQFITGDTMRGWFNFFVRGDDLVVTATQNNRAWVGIWSLRGGARRSLLADLPVSRSPNAYWVLDVNRERQALVAEDAHRIRVRDLRSGHVIVERTTAEEIRDSKWTADGARVFVGFADGHVEMLDSRTLGTLGSFQSDLGTLGLVWPDHSGGQLAVTSTDGVIQFWPSTSRPSERRTLQGRSRPVFNLAFSPDGSYVAMAADELVKLWATSDGRLRKSFGVSAGLWPAGLAFHPDGQHIVDCTNDGSVQTWDIAAIDLPALRGHASYVYPAGFAAGGSMILSGGWDGYVRKPGSVRVWDAPSGEPVASFMDGEHYVRAIAMAPDRVSAAIAISGHETHSLTLLDLRTGHQRPILDLASEWAGSLAFDPTGVRIALGCVTGVVRVVEVGTGKVVFERTQGRSRTWVNEPRVAWSPDGRTLAVSNDDSTIELLETERFAPRLKLTGHAEHVRALAYSHDGKLLASGGRDRTVRIWDAQTGRSVAVLRGHVQEVLAVAFSPDGRRLASGGHDATVRLWDTTSWEQVAALSGHEWYVYSLDWSPDGERLVSGSGDGTVRIWETKPIEERHREMLERRETLARIGPVVKRWLDELGDGKAVAGRIASDAQLGPRDREIALEALLTESVERRSNFDSPSAAMRPERGQKQGSIPKDSP